VRCSMLTFNWNPNTMDTLNQQTTSDDGVNRMTQYTGYILRTSDLKETLKAWQDYIQS